MLGVRFLAVATAQCSLAFAVCLCALLVCSRRVRVMFATAGLSLFSRLVPQVLTIHLSHPAGDILIFMTGQEDIETTCEVLADRVSELEGVPPLLVLPMYSQLPADLQVRGDAPCCIAHGHACGRVLYLCPLAFLI